MNTYEVQIFESKSVYSAKTPAGAKYQCWMDVVDALDCTFFQFLKTAKARKCPVPEDDGYGYIRRTYDVDVKVGQRVRLINEHTMNGLEGEVLYPGPTTQYVMVILDNKKDRVAVHPKSIEIIEANHEHH